ncbi:hypothetical protein BC628DRAFT_785475 [Trametes gibbosa]|nr:hypothetical protein BC628DRAFT_785475 [Trametes gibbosa]
MSSSPPAELEAYVQLAVANYIHISATALLVYDTFLTAGREVSLIWTGPGGTWRLSVLYATNRYSALLNRLMIILERVEWPGQSKKVCTAILWLDALFLVITWLSIAAFSALRVYALGGKRLWLLMLVLCFALVLPAAEIIIDLSVFVYKTPRVGCGGSSTIPLDAYRIVHCRKSVGDPF